MTLNQLTTFFGWSTILNSIVLILWLVLILAGRSWVYKIHGKLFSLSDSQMNMIHFGGMALYKLMIYFFNLVPYIALRIMAD